MPFSAAPHHEILLLLVQFCVLLVTARALGEAAQRLGQPAVVGEILAGILLGPSLLSGLVPAVGAWIVPHTELGGYLLELISLIGALFLLLITGLETDLGLIRQHARTAIGVSIGGVAVCFVSGFLLGQALPDSLVAGPGDEQRLVFALFVATAMSISAIPVIAKVLMDLGLMRRSIGQTIIAVGMSDDTIGWMLLSVVAGLATTGAITAGSVVRAIGAVVVFMIVSFTIGRWLVRRALEFVQDEMQAPDRLVTLVLAATLAWGALTQALGLEAVLGAFVMGILFGQMPRLPQTVRHRIETMGLAVFTPVFFAVAGLKVDALSLLEPRLLAITLAVIAVASGGKVVGTYLGARLIGRRDHWTALSFGAGLNARGAMEIIIATVGLELGIISQEMFSIIVVMAMATSLMAPPALRWVLRRVQDDPLELARLREEERASGSPIAQIHRVLLPLRRRPDGGEAAHGIEARLLERLDRQRPLSVTLLNVHDDGRRTESERFLAGVSAAFRADAISRRVVEADDAADAILQESAKDYDLLVLGATEPGNAPAGSVFHPLVDRLVRLAPCPAIVVSGRERSGGRTGCILVPVDGSAPAHAAAELAITLALPGQDEVVALYVLRDTAYEGRYGLNVASADRQRSLAAEILHEVEGLGRSRDVRVRAVVETGGAEDEAILEAARSHDCGLIVLGADVRPGTNRLFLGPQVERVFRAAPCPVVVYNAR